MKLAVGLGNPGPKYQKNRHNVGFWVVEQVAKSNMAASWQQRFDGEVAECLLGGEKLLLLKPQTYMNRSGQSVRKAVDFYKMTAADVLVVCDDFSLPLGSLRLRAKGTAGGQNGLKDILAHLGTDEVSRLRLGIGAPGVVNPADFVLADVPASEKQAVDDAVIDAGRAVECWAKYDIDRAMNEFNSQQRAKE